jgi:hypothetical protein
MSGMRREHISYAGQIVTAITGKKRKKCGLPTARSAAYSPPRPFPGHPKSQLTPSNTIVCKDLVHLGEGARVKVPPFGRPPFFSKKYKIEFIFSNESIMNIVTSRSLVTVLRKTAVDSERSCQHVRYTILIKGWHDGW